MYRIHHLVLSGMANVGRLGTECVGGLATEKVQACKGASDGSETP